MKTNRPQYVLRAMRVGNEIYIAPCLHGQTQVTDNVRDAEKFDDRDNLEIKCKFQKANTGMEWKVVRI